METIAVPFFFVSGLAILGSLVETYKPGFFSEHTQSSLKSMTISMLGILFSVLLLVWFLKLRVREGFEDYAYIQRWKTMMTENKVKEVCDLYTEIYEKILKVEKGAPPGEVKTDAQAREKTDERFSKLMTTTPINCKQIEDFNKKIGSVNEFYLDMNTIPDSLLISNYETANACRSLLIENYNELNAAEKRRVEGFQDVCSTKAEADERRKFLEKKKEESTPPPTCIVVEEIPLETKLKAIETKLNTLETDFSRYKKSKQDSISKILDDCKYYKEELDKKKKEAEEMSNKFGSLKS